MFIFSCIVFQEKTHTTAGFDQTAAQHVLWSCLGTQLHGQHQDLQAALSTALSTAFSMTSFMPSRQRCAKGKMSVCYLTCDSSEAVLARDQLCGTACCSNLCIALRYGANCRPRYILASTHLWFMLSTLLLGDFTLVCSDQNLLKPLGPRL